MIVTVCNQNKNVAKSLKAETWRIIKLTVVLLLFFTFKVSAKPEPHRITIVKNEIRLQEVFKFIKQQTGFQFFYDKAALQKTEPIDVSIKDATLDQALQACLKNQQLIYTIVKNTVVIRPEKKPIFQTQATSTPIVTAEPPPVEIHGKVRDENGNPLAEASVTIKGTNQGVITNNSGDFKILVPNAQTILIVSFTGYTSQEITVGSRTSIEISLISTDKSLGEVVVTALGIKRQVRTLGYSTSEVVKSQLTENRTSTTLGTLQGKVSGVNITSLGTGPQSATKITIRGQSSFSGTNIPLIVVDGMPIDNTSYVTGGDVQPIGVSVTNSNGGDGLSSINPDDIESMTVLKGGAASALYGSRAKDGVIMITTKQRGDNKGFGLEYNTNFSMETPLDFTDFQYEYGQGEGGKRPTAPNPNSGIWSFGEKFQPGMTQVLFDSVVVPYVPVYDRVRKFYRIGNNFTNTVTLSNNSQNGGFNLSFSNTDNKSIVPNSNFNKKGINLGFVQTIAKKLTAQGFVNYSNEKNRNPAQVGGQEFSTASAVYTVSNSMPWDLLHKKMLNADGDEFRYARFLPRTNPYFSAYEHFENVVRDRVFGNISLVYQINDWLYLQGRIAQDFYSRAQDYNIPNGYAAIAAAPVGYVKGSYWQEARRFRERNYDFLLGAKRKLGAFGLDLTFGGNQMYRRMEYNNVAVQDFILRGLYTVMNGRVKTPVYNLNERGINSLYGAAEVSYRNYLFVNVTGRNDWFSTLSPDNRHIFYPSVTTSFVFSDALRNAMPDWLTFGKIRAGYSQVGADNVDAYSDALYYQVHNNSYPNLSGALVPVGGINTTTIPNGQLRPLQVSEIEVGFNLGLFNNAINLDVSYYHKTSKNQIVSAQISNSSGFNNQLINIGESMNQGIETALTLAPVKTKSFRWEVNMNASYNTSRVIRLGARPGDTSLAIGGVRHIVGRPMGQIYEFMFLRDDKGNMVFDPNSGYPRRTPTRVNVGSNQPNWFGGITNSFNYKGISLSALIDFKLGKNYILNGGSNRNYWRHGLHKGTLPGRDVGYVIGEGVTPDGRVNSTKAAVQPYYESITGNTIAEPFIFKAGFWKLRQVSLNYDFTKMLLSKTSKSFIKGLRLSLVSNNVAVLKKWSDNMDPEEVYGFSNNTNNSGWSSLPITRSLGFNLNIRF